MTIKHTFVRREGAQILIIQKKDFTPNHALQYLIDAEFSYGSEVLELSPTKLITVSGVFGQTDIMTFEGTDSDMKNLVNLATIYNREKVPDDVKKSSPPTVTTDVIFNAHAQKFLSDMVNSSKRLPVAIMALLMQEFGQNGIDPMILTNHRPTDIVAMYRLIFIDGASVADAFSLLTMA